MRKRLVMGSIAVAALIGIAAYVLSQSRQGTVEWPKKEYFSSMEQMHWQRLAKIEGHREALPA